MGIYYVVSFVFCEFECYSLFGRNTTGLPSAPGLWIGCEQLANSAGGDLSIYDLSVFNFSKNLTTCFCFSFLILLEIKKNNVEVFLELLNLLSFFLTCSGRGLVQYDYKLCLPQNYSPWFIKLYGKAVTIHWNFEQ